ncbi:MAG TPA: LptF/LptG family permease [Thermoanaerobaculia bacterium]|nr:LptF/LptG family permease [Thermoanaerobaculia bacterium]
MPSMRLVSRSVVREIWPPFLLGFAAYTFVLLIRTILFLADFAVRRSASFIEVARLVALSLPWIVVLTLPMAFLLGVLIGVGRLSADSEVVALQACGLGPGALLRPALGAAAVLSLLVFGIYNLVLPATNAELERSMARVAATSIVNVVAPRTFREPRPGILFFFDRLAPDNRTFEGVFLKLGDETEPPNRVIVAKRGVLTLEEDRLWLDLFGSTVHEIDPDDPSRYRTSRNASQRLLLAGEAVNNPGTKVTIERGIRARTLSELWAAAQSLPRNDPRRRLALTELHKKLAIPFACFAFALVGVPLARSLRRGGRGSGFAISLGILVGYYVLLSSGETWAVEGRIAPALAMWLPNLALLVIGGTAMLYPAERRGRPLPRPLAEAAAIAFAPGRRTRTTVRTHRSSGFRLLSLVDRYVLARFLTALALVFTSALLISLVVDYADKIDKVARNHPPGSAVLGYYRYFLISIGLQIAPFAVLLATLAGLGVLSKNNEDTAFRASGVSLGRLGVPLLWAAVAAAILCFTVGEYVLPFAEQRQARYKNVIYGLPPETGVRTEGERNWYLSDRGEIWHRLETNKDSTQLFGVSIFRFSPDFELVGRTAAQSAAWNGSAWDLRKGWSRDFEPAAAVPYQAFADEVVPGDAPRALATVRRRPEEMRFRELERLTSRLRAGGFSTAALETALQSKIAQPALLPVMALLATPFAFRVGKRGTLAGIGLGLSLGILALVAGAFATKLGEAGALPPALAAWAPNVLFGLAAAYFLLRMRS